jgi:NAD(P)-dependent dehydrogenase (short-subunit alcohol dehydrogenase family)
MDPKVALVTGASSGIGAATVRALVQVGWTIYATARQPDRISTVGSQGVYALPLDMTDEQSMIAVMRVIEAQHGSVDVLINNAGYGEIGPIEGVTVERMRQQFETNVFGLVRLTQLVLPGMRRKSQGRIINVSSAGGEFTTPFAGVYHASKYAVESISDALRFEVEPFGVKVIVVQPGAVRTPLADATLEAIRQIQAGPYAVQVRAFQRASELSMQPDNGMLLAPDDVAQVIVHAMTDEHPQTRYKVGVMAEQMTATRRSLSDVAWDSLLRQQFGLG